jgi:hypothetical protein
VVIITKTALLLYYIYTHHSTYIWSQFILLIIYILNYGYEECDYQSEHYLGEPGEIDVKQQFCPKSKFGLMVVVTF